MDWPNKENKIQFIELPDLFNPDFYHNFAGIISEKIKERKDKPYDNDNYFRENLINILGSEYVYFENPNRHDVYGFVVNQHTQNIKGNMNHYYFSYNKTYGFNKDVADTLITRLTRPKTLDLSLEDALERRALSFKTTKPNVNPGTGQIIRLFGETLTSYDADNKELVVYNNGVNTRIPLETLASMNMKFSVINGSTEIMDDCNPDYICALLLNGEIRVLPYCMAMRHKDFIDPLCTMAHEVAKCKPITESARKVISDILMEEAKSVFEHSSKPNYIKFGDTIESISGPFDIIFKTVCYNEWNDYARRTMNVTAHLTKECKCVFKISRNEEVEK